MRSAQQVQIMLSSIHTLALYDEMAMNSFAENPTTVSEQILTGHFAKHHTFERNTSGRDIIVGDIHGHFSALSKALQAIRFDIQVDRLFALGDLVDRGPESIAALDWLSQPWFHAVLGNHCLSHILHHENVTPQGYDPLQQSWLEQLKEVGIEDDWVSNCNPTQYSQLTDALKALPVAITLRSDHGAVGLVHAELSLHYQQWGSFVEVIETGDFKALDMWRALWSRHFELRPISTRDEAKYWVPDVVALFHGHNIPWFRKPFNIANRHYIDTGAFLRPHCGEGGFTLVDINRPDSPLLASWWPDD